MLSGALHRDRRSTDGGRESFTLATRAAAVGRLADGPAIDDADFHAPAVIAVVPVLTVTAHRKLVLIGARVRRQRDRARADARAAGNTEVADIRDDVECGRGRRT